MLEQKQTSTMWPHRLVRYTLFGIIIMVLSIIPWAFGSYGTWLGSNVLILALFAVSFNLLLGYSGLLSFGQAGFFAVGAYVCAKVLIAVPWLILGLASGVLAAALLSLVLGCLCVRHTRIYFSMLTLAFGMMIHSVIWKWRAVTGGDDGLVNVPRPPLSLGLFQLELNNDVTYYYFLLLCTAIGVYLLWRLVNSPLGLALQGLRDSEQRVAFSGLSVYRYRLVAFTIAGSVAGFAGTLMVMLTKYAYPDMAHWTFSAEPIMATLMGGVSTFAGPIVGVLILYFAKEIIVRFTEYWLLLLGSTVVVLVLGFRGGVVMALQQSLPFLATPAGEGGTGTVSEGETNPTTGGTRPDAEPPPADRSSL